MAWPSPSPPAPVTNAFLPDRSISSVTRLSTMCLGKLSRFRAAIAAASSSTVIGVSSHHLLDGDDMAENSARGNTNCGVQSCHFPMADITHNTMDTHRLKYFQRIAEEGSITRAAGLLGIAQPALSRQLQLLEEELGVAVFSVTVGSTDQLVDAMLKGAVDVALINPVPDERVFYRKMLIEDLVLVGGPQSLLEATHAVPFIDVVALPLVIPRSPAGIGHALENAALRTKVNMSYRTTSDSLQVTKTLIEAGLVYGILPLSACRREVDDGLLRFAPIREPALTQQLGVAATSQLDLPRELTVKLGNTIREEVAALIKSGRWSAELLSPQPWNPSLG